MFAYIAGSSFVLENIYGISPQLFSVVFAVNSAGLIAASQLSGRAVGHLGSDVPLRRGLLCVAVAALATVLVTVAHGHDALPMAVVIGVAGLAALAINVLFAPRALTPSPVRS